jgi:hypothetical protein
VVQAVAGSSPVAHPSESPANTGFSVSEDHKLVSSWAQYGLNLCPDSRDIGPQALTRAQRLGLITRRSRVRIPPPLLKNPLVTAGFLFRDFVVDHRSGGQWGGISYNRANTRRAAEGDSKPALVDCAGHRRLLLRSAPFERHADRAATRRANTSGTLQSPSTSRERGAHNPSVAGSNPAQHTPRHPLIERVSPVRAMGSHPRGHHLLHGADNLLGCRYPKAVVGAMRRGRTCDLAGDVVQPRWFVSRRARRRVTRRGWSVTRG